MSNNQLDQTKSLDYIKFQHIKCRINSQIKYVMNELKLKKDKDKYFVTEEEFKELKFNLHLTLNRSKKCRYDYFFYMGQLNNNEYNIILSIIEDGEFIKKYVVPSTIVIKENNEFDYDEIKDTSLYDLLNNTPYEDELVRVNNKLIKDQIEFTLEGHWMLFASELNAPKIKYFESLNNQEKEIFAKAYSFGFVEDLVHQPIKVLFDIYNIEEINTFFDKIKFIKSR